MITELRFANFKSWQDTGAIRLAPITVFFGANSSGKSSIAQLLLMLKQTVDSPDRLRVLHTGDERTAVDLGTYYDMVYGHDADKTISFALDWVPHPGLSLPRDWIPVADHQHLSFEAEIGLLQKRVPELYVRRMAYRLKHDDKIDRELGLKRLPDRTRGYGLIAPGKMEHAYTEILPPPVQFYGFPEEVIRANDGMSVTRDLMLSFARNFQRLFYIGPLRSHPRRFYTWSGEVPEHVGWSGERATDAMLAAGDRQLSMGPKQPTERFDYLIAQRLKAMGLIETFRVVPIAPNRREHDVFVRTPFGAKEVNLTDVGFGMSQVLPVVVQCFYAPPYSTILIEQPELHLHPAIQGALADLFIDAVRSIERGKPRNIQLIIESHSEHFLRRLQRRIAEERMKPEDTAIYFCEAAIQGSKLTPLKIDEFGNIQNWPQNFFGDEMSDIAAIATLGAERRRDAGDR